MPTIQSRSLQQHNTLRRVLYLGAFLGERAIWQRRYWEHCIRDETDFARHVDYIHFNPVKHGHVARAVDWPYSSIHQYIKAGQIDREWGGGTCDSDEKDFGERR